MNQREAICCVLTLSLVCSAPLIGQENDLRFRLSLGDPRFKDQTVDVAPGQIISMESGRPIPFERMILEMKPVPFVYVGESHDSLPMHELQARIIQALFEQDGGLAVGLEMVPATRQEILSQWSLGLLSEEDFLRKDNWYTTWGFNFAFYRPILIFAKDHHLPLYALDYPREFVGQFQMRDGEVLAEEAKRVIPKPDPAEEDSRFLFRKGLESADMPVAVKGAVLGQMFDDLYETQAAREKDMAAQAVRVQKREDRKIVVLIGWGHLFYGLGLNRRVREINGLPSKSVVAVLVPKGRPSITVSRTLADYIIGIPDEERPAFPSIGLNFKIAPDSSRLMIANKPTNGPARDLDFKEGDIVLSVDDRTFSDIEELLTYLAGIPWGGEVRFRLLRTDVEKTIILKIEEPPKGFRPSLRVVRP